ncbi:MAG: hypothetical protein B5M51_00075 [Anaerolinea sp. 4484_236]|nr:MAG: hypothetical protein B5M51_00075 [Anaerolinea sp. 4484_236]
MKQKTLSVGKTPALSIDLVPGDLRITGWDRDEIKAKTNGSALEMTAQDEKVTLSCDGDLILSVPRAAEIKITSVEGDASLRVLGNALKLGKVAGDLALRNIGQAEIEKVNGDLVVRHAANGLQVSQIDGDASVRDVGGDVQLKKIGSDLHLRNVEDSVSTQVGADAVLFINPQEGAKYNIRADSDILLRLPQNADAEMTLSAGSDLLVNLPDVEKSDGTTRTLTLGSGSAKMTLTAGGDLRVTSRADEWASLADFDISLPFIGADFPGIPDDLAEQISRKADVATRKMDRKIHKAERKIHHAERKMRHAERRAHAHEKRFNRSSHWGGEKKPSDPVSDDERLLILKMLQEKKISADDAEKLLSALEE